MLLPIHTVCSHIGGETLPRTCSYWEPVSFISLHCLSMRLHHSGGGQGSQGTGGALCHQSLLPEFCPKGQAASLLQLFGSPAGNMLLPLWPVKESHPS